MYVLMSDRIPKNVPAFHSEKVPAARIDHHPLGGTSPWLGENPSRKHVTGTSSAGCHVNTKHSSKLKELKI